MNFYQYSSKRLEVMAKIPLGWNHPSWMNEVKLDSPQSHFNVFILWFGGFEAVVLSTTPMEGFFICAFGPSNFHQEV